MSELLADARIIRSRAKVEAVISDARAASALPERAGGFVWRYAPSRRRRTEQAADVPASAPESAALARRLKQRRFRFVGRRFPYFSR